MRRGGIRRAFDFEHLRAARKIPHLHRLRRRKGARDRPGRRDNSVDAASHETFRHRRGPGHRAAQMPRDPVLDQDMGAEILMQVIDDFFPRQLEYKRDRQQFGIVDMIEIGAKRAGDPQRRPRSKERARDAAAALWNGINRDAGNRFAALRAHDEMGVETGLRKAHAFLVEDTDIECRMCRRDMHHARDGQTIHASVAACGHYRPEMRGSSMRHTD